MDEYGYGYGSSGVSSEIEEDITDDNNNINNNNNNNTTNTITTFGREEGHANYAAGSSSMSMGMIGEEEEECAVYVGVGKGHTSMEALSWTLNNLVKRDDSATTTTVYLIHVFPEVKHIPNPLGAGMIAKSKVSGEVLESYMAQERAKRRDLLHKFIQSCSASSKVNKVDTILIESDFIAKAILDLIPILNITNLVIGATKNHHRLRSMSSSRKWNGSIADQIEQNAPDFCKLRIICEGKEVLNEMMMTPTNNSPHHHTTSISNNNKQQHHHQNHEDDDDLPSCICFKPKFR